MEQLFKTHYRQMRRVASALLHDDDTARDVVQDVFASLLSNPPETQITSGYLLAAVRNRCLNRIRDLSMQNRVSNLYFAHSDEHEVEDWPDEETIARIYEIIKMDLTPQCREIMELRFSRGLKFVKIAEMLGISENSVYKHVRQAIVIIRKKLSENG